MLRGFFECSRSQRLEKQSIPCGLCVFSNRIEIISTGVLPFDEDVLQKEENASVKASVKASVNASVKLSAT